MAAQGPADDAHLRTVGALARRHRRHQLLRQRRRPGRHHRRRGRLHQEAAGRRTAETLPLRGARRHRHRGRGAGGRHLHGGRALGRTAAQGGERGPALGAHGHPPRRVERPADLVRVTPGAHPRLHCRQRRHRAREEPGLPGRHLPRGVRPAVGGAGVARHRRAGPQSADQASVRAVGRGPRRLHGLPQVRREGARRAAVGCGPPLGCDRLLDPALRGRPGRGVPRRHGPGGPGAPAPQTPADVPDASPAPAALPWFTPDSDPGTATNGQLSAPHENGPTTQTREGHT